MALWFETTVSFDKMMENGAVKKGTEKNLFDALSFTEAEERTIEELTPYISGEFTKDKRESPRLQSLDESASMFFLILDISDYGISRNTSDRLAEIRTRPQRRQTGAQLCKFLTQNSR